ncbi:LAMI_0F02036g1_1 [Lachancea mirantina]|uniref:LAMI_0F02036g1_1 n=1 Tax=Lachancea mirantina TaxID=1230905 RepID=A0A1G4JWA3_9SACH|nr:LAMI_0F02036g1_1 [Lachancea mirantina]
MSLSLNFDHGINNVLRTHCGDQCLLESQAGQTLREFRPEIFSYLWELDSQDGIDVSMIDHQPELEWKMRPFLIDFLVELHAYFRLNEATLFLAGSIVDRYLSKRVVYSRHYQLVVTTALWIAAKYEDKKSRTPLANELVMLCRNVYTSQMFAQMEMHILTSLDWNISSVVTVQQSLSMLLDFDVFTRNSVTSSRINELSMQLALYSLYAKNYMYFSSTVKALSALAIASKILDDNRAPQIIIDGRINSHYVAGDSGLSVLDEYWKDNQRKVLNLQIDQSCYEDIRKCCLFYISDIFDTLSSETSGSRVLQAKIKASEFQQDLVDYTRQNLATYLQLCMLSRASGAIDRHDSQKESNVLADILTGLASDDILEEAKYQDTELLCAPPKTPVQAFGSGTTCENFGLWTSPFRTQLHHGELSELPETPTSTKSSSIFSNTSMASIQTSTSSPSLDKPSMSRFHSNTLLTKQLNPS